MDKRPKPLKKSAHKKTPPGKGKRYAYRYPRPALAVDCVVFGIDDFGANEGGLKALLIERRLAPFAGQWALPGGFVHLDESLDEAARRELKEETGLTDIYLEQLYTFGAPDRDPRERVVSVAYYALVRLGDHTVKAATDARSAAWFGVDALPPLAFDHERIFQLAHQRLQSKVRYQPIGFELLPAKFTLRQLQRLYEIIVNRRFDKWNFRKKFLAMDLLEELDEFEAPAAHRAARLYRFHREKYERFTQQGFLFEIEPPKRAPALDD